MSKYKIGSEVRWVHAVASPEKQNAVGIVLAVFPNDTDLDEFTMYDVEFSFGMFMLYGTQIEHENASWN